MKFSSKIFLCVLLILTAALSSVEYLAVAGSLSNTMEHQTEEALRQHRLVTYALRADLLSAEQSGTLTSESSARMAEQTAKNFSIQLCLQDETGTVLYANTDLRGTRFETNRLNCRTVRSEAGTVLLVSGGLERENEQLRLTTARDVSFAERESAELQRTCRKVLIAAVFLGGAAAFALSYVLTGSVRRLSRVSRQYAGGDYSARISVDASPGRQKDEMEELSVSFNRMADTIQEKLEELEAEVRRKQDFVAAFAHELKTPMTSIIGYADTICQRELSPEESKEAAGYILNEGLRLEALSFKLMELVNLNRQSFVTEEMNMADVLRDVEETALPNAVRRQMALSVRGESGYARVEVDLMKTLLLNLIDNAMKSGGTKVLVTGKADNGVYRVSVADNGRGIPKEELHRITEAFYMVDKARSRKEHGAGLGLALCQKIAELHGSGLEFSSIEGRGTKVSFALPMTGEAET